MGGCVLCMYEWLIEFMAGWVVSGRMCRWWIDGNQSWVSR